VEPDSGGQFAVWVRSDDQLERAESLLDRFRRDPSHRDFEGVIAAARHRRTVEEKEAQAAGSRFHDKDTIWKERTPVLTIALIFASIAVTIMTRMGDNLDAVRHFSITEYWVTGSYVEWQAGLPEIRRGEVWRLVTPIFLHFHILHILFNMLWMKDLGGIIERRLGTWFLGIFVVIVAIASNLGQYLVSAPNFGGMSGVVYGLLGFAWMKGRFDPNAGFALHHTTVAMMLIWFVLCLTGLVGPIANTAHGVGLGLGVAWGYASALRSARR
jgi:GlpG protein